MATLHHHGIFQDSFIFLNMFENPVSIKLAFYRFSIPTKGSDISKANHELYRYTNDYIMLEFNVHFITGVIPLVLPVLPTEAVVNKQMQKYSIDSNIVSVDSQITSIIGRKTYQILGRRGYQFAQYRPGRQHYYYLCVHTCTDA